MNTNIGQIKSDITSRATRGLRVRSGLRAGEAASGRTKTSDKLMQQVIDYVKS